MDLKGRNGSAVGPAILSPDFNQGDLAPVSNSRFHPEWEGALVIVVDSEQWRGVKAPTGEWIVQRLYRVRVVAPTDEERFFFCPTWQLQPLHGTALDGPWSQSIGRSVVRPNHQPGFGQG